MKYITKFKFWVKECTYICYKGQYSRYCTTFIAIAVYHSLILIDSSQNVSIFTFI